MSIFPGVQEVYWNTRATAPRRVKPHILAAIHITDNSALMSAMNEAVYSNRIGTGASFTFVNNRNGTTVQCLHPEWQIPFTNGAWTYPNRTLWTVNHALQYGIGANDSTFMTIENVGRESLGAGLTTAQIEKCAQLIAYGSRITGIKPNRATVLAHGDYDSWSRANCPTYAWNRENLLWRIINRANQILAPAPAPAPTPTPTGVPNVLLRQVQQDWTTRNGGEFWTNGPGLGQKKFFNNGTRIRSHFEQVVPTSTGITSGQWRVVSYNGEGLWIHRNYITPISGTRRPSSGWGPP